MIAGVFRGKGHACAVEQDINPVIAHVMPLNVATCGLFLMRLIGSTSVHRELTARRDYVRRLILHHQQVQTPCYPKGIDEEYLNKFPDNGIPDDDEIGTTGKKLWDEES